MPRFRLFPALFLVVTSIGTLVTRAEKARKPSPALAAQEYGMQDHHPKEHVTIAAEPGDTRETRPDTRLDYYGHDLMPMRVIVTNDSEFALTLDDARIHLITGDNNVIAAATEDDLERRLFTVKSATGSKVPLPLPLPPVTVHHGEIDKKIAADDKDFGFPTTTVAPHTTVSGYLYYDMQGVDPPFLNKATLELRKVRFAGTNQALESFEIPLHPTGKDASAAGGGQSQP